MKRYATTYILSIYLLFVILTYSLSLPENHVSFEILQTRALDSPLLPRGEEKREKRKKPDSGSPPQSERRVSARIQGLPPLAPSSTPPQSRAQSPKSNDGRPAGRLSSSQVSDLAQGMAQLRIPSPVQGLPPDANSDRIIVPYVQPTNTEQTGHIRTAGGAQNVRQQAGLPSAGTQNVQVCLETWMYECRLTAIRTTNHNSGPSTNTQNVQSLLESNMRQAAGSGRRTSSRPRIPLNYHETPSQGLREPRDQGFLPPSGSAHGSGAQPSESVLYRQNQQNSPAQGSRSQGPYHGAVPGLQQAGNQASQPGEGFRTFTQSNSQFTQQHRQQPGQNYQFNHVAQTEHGNVLLTQTVRGNRFSLSATNLTPYNARSADGIYNQRQIPQTNRQPPQHAMLGGGGGPLHFHDNPPREQPPRDLSYLDLHQAPGHRLPNTGAPAWTRRRSFGDSFAAIPSYSSPQRQMVPYNPSPIPRPSLLGGGPLHFNDPPQNTFQKQSYNSFPIGLAGLSGNPPPNQGQSAHNWNTVLNLLGNQPRNNLATLGEGHIARATAMSSLQNPQLQNQALRRYSSQGENLPIDLTAEDDVSPPRGRDADRQRSRNTRKKKGKEKKS